MRAFIFLIALLIATTGCTKNSGPPIAGTVHVHIHTMVPKAVKWWWPAVVLQVTVPGRNEHAHCWSGMSNAACDLKVNLPIRTGDPMTISVGRQWAWPAHIRDYLFKEIDHFDGTAINDPTANVEDLDITVSATFTPTPTSN